MAQRIKTVQESDLRMLGSLARSIQRVLPVTQADIDAAAALGQGWVVTRVFEVSDPLNNLRGGTQLVIRQNSILPGQSVQRVLIVSGPGGQTVVIRGTDYITLSNAIANSLQYVKAFGGTEQRNVPVGYTQVDGITNLPNTVINTGVIADVDDMEFELEVSPTTSSWYIFQSRESGNDDIYGISGANVGSLISSSCSGVSFIASSINRNNLHKLYVKATFKNGNATLYVKDLVTDAEETVTGTYTFTPATQPIGLFGNIVNGSMNNTVMSGNTIYFARMKKNGQYVMNYIPAKDSNDNAGFYDTVSDTFITPMAGSVTAGADVVPTPDTPVDIICNNGAVKVRNKSGLPLGYQRVEYLESSGEQLIDLGFKWTYNISTKTDCEMLESTSTALGCVGARNSGSVVWGNFVANNNTNYTCFGNKVNVTFSQDMIDGQFHTWETNNNGFYLDGVQKTNLSGSDPALISNDNTCLFGRYDGSGNIERCGKWKIKSHQTYNDNVLMQNLVPCRRNSDSVLGMYDTVTGVFFTNAGTGDFTAGADVDDMEIYADGTVETISVHGKNLFDKNTITVADGYYTAEGEFRNSTTTGHTVEYIKVLPNTTYTISGNLNNQTDNKGIVYCYDDDKNFVYRLQNTGVIGNYTFTTPANCSYVRFQIFYAYYDKDTIQLELGSTATAYEPYFNGGTATAEMLLKIGGVVDEQEILGGNITRNIGIKVLDGTEDWSAVTNGYSAPVLDASLFNHLVCTHFVNGIPTTDLTCSKLAGSANLLIHYDAVTTVSAFKAFLASEYANDTPVIVLYCLENEITESVAGQALQVQAGNNTLEITQASLDGLELEVKYKKNA